MRHSRSRVAFLWIASVAILTACRTAPPPPPPSPGESVFYTFEKYAPGTLPVAWSEPQAAVAGAGAHAVSSAALRWRVDDVGPAPSGTRALVHGGAAAPAPVCLRDASYGAVKIQTMVRCQGDADFAVLWRVSGPDSRLAFRVRGADGTLAIERGSGEDAEVLVKTVYPAPSSEWFAVSIEHAGDRIACGVNGAILLETTLADAPPRGSAGVCQYSASGRVEFDNFSIVGRAD
jgi:hypothetical protein